MVDRSSVLMKVIRALHEVVDDKGLEIQAAHHLVDELGIDSVDIASLTIALEDEFDDILLLNEWIASASSPSDLTVQSLADYIFQVVSEPD